LSLFLHVGAVVAWFGFKLWQAWPVGNVNVDVVGTTVVTDLPLGDQAKTPATPTAPSGVVSPAGRHPHPKAADHSGEKSPDVADDKAPLARPTSLGQYAPEGSRLTALLRVDRLRNTPFAAAVDGILVNLPDRRNLLEGTDLDLYRDFDALLIATPNPLDATVTFLAARHRLKDSELRAALDRAARSTGRALSWQTVGGRPLAERHPAASTSPASWRDQRLILLPAPRLVVVTPPAYRDLLLHPRRPPPKGGADGGVLDGGAPAVLAPDGGKPAEGAAPEPDWTQLVRRLDAQDSILPPDAVAMLHASDVLGPRKASLVPGTRGTSEDSGAAPQASILGLPVPRVLDLILGIRDTPFAELTAGFEEEAQAVAWESAWPELHAKLRGNPLLVFSGFSGLIDRIHVERGGSQVTVKLAATQEETLRILNFAAAQAAAMRAR
jgi:hypothetical protein